MRNLSEIKYNKLVSKKTFLTKNISVKPSVLVGAVHFLDNGSLK